MQPLYIQIYSIWNVYNQQEQNNIYWFLLYLYLLKRLKRRVSESNHQGKRNRLTPKQERTLYREFERELNKDSEKIQQYIEKHLKDTYIKTWDATRKNLDSNTPLPSYKEIYEDINKVWVGEKNFKQRQQHNTNIIKKKLKKILQDEYLTIEEKNKLAKKVLTQFEHMVKRLVRTETIHTIGQASIRCMRENNISEVIWITCMDERTCKICGARDKWVYPIDMIPQYPDHPNCRCLLIPYKRGVN